MGRRNRRRPTQTRRRAASAASFFAPSPDDLGLRPLTADADAANARALLIAAMSQELRTPLNAIIGYVHLLGDPSQSLTSQQREDVRQLQASAGRLARAIDRVIELARLECGRIELAIETTDLTTLADAARRRAIAATGVEDARIALVHDGLPLCADVDPMRLLDALAAIVRHLLRLSPGWPLAIVVRRAGADAVVSIAAEPSAASAMGRRSARRPAGSLPWGEPALDIAAAARLVELLGGSVAVEADPDVGSRFVMRLPVTRNEPPRLGSPAASE
ncbi:MAG TPA: HAMP domain-containing sensor histidine kinase [Thermomicrobiales bacterium]|nr:HAMP domain-containing sensor histidine kinase [Thermomicrobiales bacterium]